LIPGPLARPVFELPGKGAVSAGNGRLDSSQLPKPPWGYDLVGMKRFRHHRWSARLSLLAMVALPWSQVALSSHPACTLASMALTASHAVQGDHGGPAPEPCHPAPPADTSAACESHCSRSDLSPDVTRVLAVPALGPLPAVPVVNVQHLPRDPDHAATLGPQCSWHRPTAHPASLLLI
jgi:hypothetical protein